jgi:hypothetical protein
VSVDDSYSSELVSAAATWAAQYNLRARAFDGCSKWLLDGDNGLDGWTAEDIQPEFASCSLIFEHQLLGYPFMETRLNLFVGADHTKQSIGHYPVVTRLDGTDDDDYFVIDVHKPSATQA